jgi:hypothetical protein
MREEDAIRSTVVMSSWPPTPAIESAGWSMEAMAAPCNSRTSLGLKAPIC